MAENEQDFYEGPWTHDDPSWSPESAARFGIRMGRLEVTRDALKAWWPPALRAALYSWQQTCDEQEMELATLRGIAVQAQRAVDSFDRKPTEGCVSDHVGLAESLWRYREMRDGRPNLSLPRIAQARSAK